MTRSHRLLSPVHYKCAKGLTPPSPLLPPPCVLYSVIQVWLIRASDSRVSAHLLGKDGTDLPLILTAPPTKGIFLMSRKHCFLIRDTRPISQRRQGSSCGERLAHIKPQTLNSWLWPIITRQDKTRPMKSGVGLTKHFILTLKALKTCSYFPSEKPRSEQLSLGWSWPCCWGIQPLIDW